MQEDTERRGKWDGDSNESSTPRFNPLASRESLNSLWSNVLRRERTVPALGPLKDRRRVQPEVEKFGKLNRAYGPVLPPDLTSLKERSVTSLNVSKSGRPAVCGGVSSSTC